MEEKADRKTKMRGVKVTKKNGDEKNERMETAKGIEGNEKWSEIRSGCNERDERGREVN